jgi:hypothetical protein
MEEKISFIPQKTLTKPIYRTGGIGFFMFVSIVVLVISALLFGGAYFYKGMVKNRVDVAVASLKKAQDILDPALIEEVGDIDAKIEGSKIILNQHRATTRVFEFLENSTLDSVRFSGFDFSYPLAKDGKPVLVLKGSTKGYSFLALQSEEFLKNKLVKNIAFSDFTLSDKGKVNFTASVEFDPGFLVYKSK